MGARKIRDNLINETKKKHPEIKDQAEIEKLIFSEEKKKRLIMASVFFAVGVVFIAAAFFVSLRPVSLILIFMGGIILYKGIEITIPIIRKSRKSKDDSKKAVIDMKYLKTRDIKVSVRNAFIQLVGLVILLVYFYRIGSGSGILLLVALGYIGILTPYWVKRIRKCSAAKKAVREESFKIVKTVLHDKSRRKSPKSTPDHTHFIYCLIFRCRNYFRCDFKEIVSETEFAVRQLDEECYLMLCPDSKAGGYEIDRVFWSEETVVSNDLERFIV